MSHYGNTTNRRSGQTPAQRLRLSLQLFLAAICLVSLNGCGGGYAGGAAPGLASSHVAIDGGQSFMLVVTNPQNLPLGWAVSGAACSGGSCGVISDSSTGGATFTAPQVSQQLTVTVQTTVTGTSSTSTTSIVINPAPKVTGSTPDGTVGAAYSTTFAATGGTGTLKWQPVMGTLPAGLSFNASTGVLSGTPTAAGDSRFTLQAIDQSDVPFTASAAFTIHIGTGNDGGGGGGGGSTTPLSATGSTPDGTVGTPYVALLQAGGGTPPYAWSILSGSLPAGLSLSSTGVISGTPTAAGTANFTAQVQDAAGATAPLPLTLKINTASQQPMLTLTTSTLPSGTVQVPYASNIGVTGGTAPYTCTLVSGTLPAGLSLGANCTVTGTPTTAGTSNFTVRATDSSNPNETGTGQITIVINPAPAVITIASPPTATVGTPYNGVIPITGGSTPYTCVLTTGTMPAGLTLNSNCVITGTPILVGTTSVGVTATDSSNPANSSTATVTITVQAPMIVLTLTTPPDGIVGVPYAGAILVAGGTAPYQCSLVSGTLPAGLTLASDCTITGTPTTPGASTFGVTVTDSANPANTQTSTLTITIQGNLIVLTITAPPAGIVGIPYIGPIVVVGGTAPYTCTATSGNLPAGLTLNANCIVTGTPTNAGTSTVGVTVTDAAHPTDTKTSPVTISIMGPQVTLTIASPPPATINTPYNGIIPVTGGTAPYTCNITGGTLPAGLSLGANCTITGTPTTAGNTNVGIMATDSSNPANTATAPITITVQGATTTLTVSSPPAATVNTPYNTTIPVAGGTAPYQCTIVSGTLPAGLSLGAHCSITGTPTTAGTSNLSVKATDSATPQNTGTGNISLQVNPIAKLTLTGTLPKAIVGQAYTQTLHAAGGLPPYRYAVTAGALPDGLSLSTDGVISGTPTTVGASGFTVTATDSESTPQTASLPLLLQVAYPVSPNDNLLKGPYAFLFQGYDNVVAGVLAYQTATVGSFTADGQGLLTMGEFDTNHQGSNPAGSTVAAQNLLGSYTVGADGRGTIAVTSLNGDGTVGATTVYNIALKLPTATGTAATSGSLIEADGNILASTKGSGSLLAQTTSAYAAGLNGSYAFGLSGDTPCLPTCTLGLVAGPAASVGQFSANGGTIAGTGDATIASTTYASSTLGGSAAATDANGRISLTLTSAKLATLSFPTHYAVYLVDASHAFLMSTDKHSAFILQAGTAQLQSQTAFSNASLNGPYVGYENAAVNPGLIGTALSSVLNLSSATVFRGTGNAKGTCTTTNVDVGGLTGLINTLTGLGGGSNLLNALLGTFQSLGDSSCPVASNGRAVLNYPNPDSLLSIVLGLLGLGNQPPPARVAYLTGNNEGYFLETGYAGLGQMAAQTGSPFAVSTLKGTFNYSTVPASSLVTIDAEGSFTADGAGNASSTLDSNVGVGNLNVLQLGVADTTTYSLTDAAAGRYTLGSRVIYAISPNRYVLLEASPLNTAPYVALLF